MANGTKYRVDVDVNGEWVRANTPLYDTGAQALEAAGHILDESEGTLYLFRVVPVPAPRKAWTHTLHEGKWRVVEVEEGEAGYHAKPPRFTNEDRAAGAALWLNTHAGLTATDVAEILASALQAQERADALEFGDML